MHQCSVETGAEPKQKDRDCDTAPQHDSSVDVSHGTRRNQTHNVRETPGEVKRSRRDVAGAEGNKSNGR